MNGRAWWAASAMRSFSVGNGVKTESVLSFVWACSAVEAEGLASRLAKEEWFSNDFRVVVAACPTHVPDYASPTTNPAAVGSSKERHNQRQSDTDGSRKDIEL